MIKIEGRSLKIPTQERIIGWVGDNRVEVRIFELIRHYGDIDLAGFDFKLDTQSGDVKNIIDLDKTVADDKITLTWTVKESHILNPGHMSIQIRAFSAGEEKWHSAQGYVKVQPSINAEQSIPDPLPSEFVQMEQRVTVAKNAAIGAAQDAEAHADRAQDIADTFSDVTLPAAISAVENAGQAKVDLAEAQAIIATTKAQEASDSAAAALASEQATKTSEDNAAEQADRAQDIADTFENETLPAAITAVEAAGQAKVDLAEQQANIAAGHAQTAAAKAEETSGYVNDAFEYKEAAEGAASIATEKAWEAANSAQIAEQQAGIAATKATEAYDSAERAKMSEEAVEGVADEHRLKIAKIERELNDYKTIMSMVNINLEPKQQVSGYGIVSLPKNAANGQISVTLKGNTYFNSVINGSFAQGITGWQGNAATISAVNNILSITGNGTSIIPNVANASSYRSIIGRTGKKIFLRAKARVTNSVCNSLDLYINPTGDAVADVLHAKTIAVPVQNQWYDMFGIVTLTAGYENKTVGVFVYHKYPDAVTTNGKVMEVREILAIDLDQHPELANLTADQINARIPNYIDGTKSTISAMRLKSVGKNLLNLSNGQQTINGITIVVEDGEVLINGTTTSAVWIKLTGGFEATSSRPSHWINDSLRIKPGNYTLSRNSISGTGTSMTLAIRNQNDEMAIGMAQTTNSQTGFLDDNLSYVYLFIASGAVFNNYRFRPQLEIGEKATDYESYKESNAYVIAKDEEGNILELRSLPNGTKDEFNIVEGKHIKKVSDPVSISDTMYASIDKTTYVNVDVVKTTAFSLAQAGTTGKDGMTRLYDKNGVELTEIAQTDIDNTASVGKYYWHTDKTLWLIVAKGAYADISAARTALGTMTLIYQLAQETEIPIQVSGTLVGYPSGTVFIEPMVADAGVYTNEMTILYQDLPIKAIKKLSKVDFMTGAEIELDENQATIAEDKKSFTHPGLVAGDIVFFTYEYDREGTIPEAEIEYYDSRYVIKDSVTDKFYKWHIIVADGVPSIELVEV